MGNNVSNDDLGFSFPIFTYVAGSNALNKPNIKITAGIKSESAANEVVVGQLWKISFRGKEVVGKITSVGFVMYPDGRAYAGEITMKFSIPKPKTQKELETPILRHFKNLDF